jgi:hypothetical protein
MNNPIYCYGVVIYCKYFLSSKSSKHRFVFKHRSFHLAFVKLQTDTVHGFLLILSIPLSVPLHQCHVLTLWPSLTLHNLTILLGLSLKHMSVTVVILSIKISVSGLEFSYPDSSGLVSGLNNCMLCGQSRNWYIIIPFWTFTGITLLSLRSS